MLTPSQIILIVTAGIIFLFGAFIGFKIGDARLRAFEAVIKIQTQAQEARTKKVEAESTKQTQEINDAYQAGITSLNQYYTKRLRDATIAQRLPAIPNTTISFNGPTSHAFLANDPKIADYDILAGQCAATTLQLEDLQKWVREQAATLK